MSHAAPDRDDVARDVRDCLTLIRGYARLLQDDWPAEADGRACAAEILAAADRLAGVIERTGVCEAAPS